MLIIGTILGILVVVSVTEVWASHFRGAIITWKPGENQNEIIVDYRISWRMSYSYEFSCNDGIIVDGVTIGGEGYIECFDNCAGVLGRLFYQCTDYSKDENWSSGRGRITATINPQVTPGIVQFGFDGSAWIDNLNVGGGGDWRLRVTADFITVRSDTNKINSSPTAEIAPVVRLQHNCNHTISLPVGDIDGDVVRCRWAETRDECGEICSGLPNAYLDNEICSISYSASYHTGWYAVAIQVEDFANSSSTHALSSIPVQFLVYVYTFEDTCNQSIRFIAPTPPDDACIGVPEGEIYNSGIVVRVGNAARSVSEIKTTSPLGMTKSRLYKVSPTDWRVNITWSPPNDIDVTHVFCFNAKETSGLEGEKRCIKLLAGVTPPAFVAGSQTPTNTVFPGQRKWTLAVDADFVQATRQSYIKLYSDNNVLIESVPASNEERVIIDTTNRNITFVTTTTLTEKQIYYFVFDFGVVKGKTYCGAESPAVDDASFWRIRIRDITPPSIMFNAESVTNANSTVEWSINEPVSVRTCQLTRPSGSIEPVIPCKSPWSEKGLAEGVYVFTVAATDLEDNSATVKHVWRVDTTPPVLTMLETPSAVTNLSNVYFKWICNYPCDVTCTVVSKSTGEKYHGNCWRRGLDWTIPSMDSNVTYTLELGAEDSVGNENRISYSWVTDFVKPTIDVCDLGQSFTHDCTSDSKPETVCNATSTDNMDVLPELTYTDRSTGSCGIIRTWTAKDNAGNTERYEQNITFVTERNFVILEYPHTMSVSCGSLDNLPDVLISMFKISHPCGLDVNITFKDDLEEQCGIIIQRIWTIADGCGNHETKVQYLRIREARKPLAPVDGQIGTDLTTILRWPDPDASTHYDIYFWDRGFGRPTTPLARTSENFYEVSSLKPGTQYLWQLVFYYSNNDIYISPIWVFETRHYVDLIVESIVTPPSAFSGQNCEVKWTVRNVGTIDTPYTYWYDEVYLSWTDSLQGAQRVARVRQRNILYINDGYSATATFTLDERTIGSAYIFIKTNIYFVIEELDTTNNVMRSLATIDVQLTPPPDLQVTSIAITGNRFYSGSEVQISWTVLNTGIGPTRSNRWTDRVIWATNNTLETLSKTLARISHTGDVDQQQNYTVKATVRIPEFVTGDFYILVETDIYDQVYEFLGEDNNVASMQNPVYVALTPPPDLQIASIVTPPVWTTGDTVNVSWTVVNAGSDTPSSQRYWVDSLVISGSGTGIINTYRHHHGALSADGTYTPYVTIYVSPTFLTDKYTIQVTADYRNHLFEYSNDANNDLTSYITIRQELPDFSVEHFSVDMNYEPNITLVSAQWSVKNIGNGKPLGINWDDKILVKSATQTNFIQVFRVTVNLDQELLSNDTYNRTGDFKLPFFVYGPVIFKLETDMEPAISGDESLTNNRHTLPTIPVDLRAADLRVRTISTSKYIQDGKSISVTYDVRNEGSLDLSNVMWKDSVYISDTDDNIHSVYGLNVNHDVQIDLKRNQTYSKTLGFNLPDEMSGPYMLHVDTNVDRTIFEGPNISNNVLRKEITVAAALYADLSVTEVNLDFIASESEETIVHVEWNVQNIGNSMDRRREWHDAILFKQVDTTTSVLNTYSIKYILEYQASYRKNENIVIPTQLLGDVFICVHVVFSGYVYEAKSAANNIMCNPSPIHIQIRNPALLSASIDLVSSVSDNNSFNPGSTVKIHFSVENTGTLTTARTSWLDSIYVSNVDVENTSDLKRMGTRVKDIVHIGSLEESQNYIVVSNFQIPSAFSGTPRIYIVPNNTESDELIGNDNNQNYSSLSKSPILDYSYLLANLRVISDLTLHGLHGGQPVTIDYNIVNTGNTSVSGIWYDSAYLSEDIILDAFDFKLKSEQREFTINPNSSVLVNISFILPIDLQTKQYMLAVVCDSRDDIFESDERDNELRIEIRMEARMSTDIAVLSVVAPPSVAYGNNIQITWEVENYGSKEAQGYKCDSVYFSDDELWDIKDMQIGKPMCSKFILGANGTLVISETLTTATPQVAASVYKTLVKSRSNVIDINSDNDIGVAAHKTKVTYAILNVDETTHQRFTDFTAFQIPNILEDETLVITVQSNESIMVYIKSGSPASLFNFDIASDDPTSNDQTVTVPDTINGDYYVLIEGSNRQQRVTIYVKYADFEIIDVNPKTILPNAQTTLKVKGALFPADMRASIYYLTDSNIVYDSIQTLLFTSGLAYATFNLPEDVQMGESALSLSSTSLNTTIIFEHITVKTGVQGYLATHTDGTRRLRTGQTGTFQIRLQNLGDSDVKVPILNVEASGGGSFKLYDDTREELYRTQYLLFCISPTGPSGILLPKEYCELQFELKQDETGPARMAMRVTEMVQNEETANPFIDLKNKLRPSHYDEQTWNTIWQNFVELTGTSSLTLGNRMANVLNEMSVAGRHIRPVDAILNYLLAFADAPNGDTILDLQTDMTSYSEKNIRLIVDRYMPSRIGSRKQNGFMGPGWILPLWDTFIKQVDETDLILTLHKEDYNFLRVDTNVYIHRKLGTLTRTESGFLLRRHDDTNEYIFDKESLKLSSVVSLTDNSWIKLEYEEQLLTTIQHSDGPFVFVKYNDQSKIQSMGLINSTAKANAIYGYDFDTGLLMEVQTDTDHTRYTYKYSDLSLHTISFDDNAKFVFEYNQMGHVSARRYFVSNKEIESQIYTYTEGGMFNIHSWPVDTEYNLTYSESGDIISVHRPGFLPNRVVTTKDTQTNYDGDQVITKRTFGKNAIVIEDGNHDSVEAKFNDLGLLVKFKDGRKNEYNVELNTNGTIHRVKFPDGTNKTYSYFENGHRTKTQTGSTKVYEYDENNRLVMKDIGNNLVTSYEYNDSGYIQRGSNYLGEIVINYEGTSVSNVSYPDKTINYRYSDKKRITEISSNDGYLIKYDLNDLQQLTKVFGDNNTVLLTAEYTDSGKLKKKTLGNNANTVYEYDSNTGLLESLFNYYPNGSLASYFTYTFSSRNRRIVVTSLDGTWTFKYDRAGQVTSMRSPNGDVTTYKYDASKNRKSVSVNGVEAQNKVNQMNQYTQYGSISYNHDQNGNLIKKNRSAGKEVFKYNEDNRLVSYESTGTKCDFHYDAFGNLYSKICNGETTRYVTSIQGIYDTDVIEQVKTNSGIEDSVRFYHGGDKIGLIASKVANQTFNYFMFDPIGSVVNILLENGDLLNSYQRDPFGNSISSSDKVSSIFTFVGQWGVVDIVEIPDVFHMRTRLYDAYTGRFMSLDTIGLRAHSKNFYAYCSNDPVSYNDPRGTYLQYILSAGFGAVKSVSDYKKITRLDERTLGGAFGAGVEGGINGAVAPLKIPSLLKGIISDVASVAGTFTQKMIDNEPYPWRDAVGDLGNKFLDRGLAALEQKFEKIFKIFNKVCGFAEKVYNYTGAPCDWKDKLKDILRDWGNKLLDDIILWIQSLDPNDMLGPNGYGPARFISKDIIMKYTIRYENDANATAPAQRVYVEHTYSEHLDPRHFMLGKFGFGNFTKEIPLKSKFYQETLNLTNDIGMVVQVFAGLDFVKKVIAWEFQTIDPKTGSAPTDPGIGFLPPNNGTSGQGFVTFSIKCKKDIPHLTVIHANSSIFFDQNEPIDTPDIFNTIDDSFPVMNGSIISGTESQDSVTLALRALDSGSGVKHVELFQRQGDSFTLYRSDITEPIYVLRLETGDPITIFPVAVDHVENRINIQDIDQDAAINVNVTIETEVCVCSGYGNCTDGSSICVCEKGFYGTNCNRTTPPLEPPVLEVRSKSGYANEPFELTVSARNISGTLEDLSIVIYNIPSDIVFSKGTVSHDGNLHLEHSDFGKLNITATRAGDIELTVTVTQSGEETVFHRSTILRVRVYPYFESVSVQFEGCVLRENNTGLFSNKVLFDGLSIDKLWNNSLHLPYHVSFTLPTWVYPYGRHNPDRIYAMDSLVEEGQLSLARPFQVFSVTVRVLVEPEGVPAKEFTFNFEINRNCSSEENECDCVANHTIECRPVFNSCTCLPEWTGDRCELDVNECLTPYRCVNRPNADCHNKEWGYDCLCLEGYAMINNKCEVSMPPPTTLPPEIDVPTMPPPTTLPPEIDVPTMPPPTTLPPERTVSITVRLSIELSAQEDLENNETYTKYSGKVDTMLTNYFFSHLGDRLIDVIIRGLRKGSLIVEHDVVVKNEEESIQQLTLAAVELTSFTDNTTSSLLLDGQHVSVEHVSVEGKSAMDACDVFTTLNPCDDTGCLVDSTGIPSCGPIDKEKDESKINTTGLVIAIAVTTCVIILAIIITVSVCKRKKNNNLQFSPVEMETFTETTSSLLQDGQHVNVEHVVVEDKSGI